MLRDNLVGLIEPMRNSAGFDPLALGIQKQASDDRPSCLENPRPAGAESSLTENAASPFQAEPAQRQKNTTKWPKPFMFQYPSGSPMIRLHFMHATPTAVEECRILPTFSRLLPTVAYFCRLLPTFGYFCRLRALSCFTPANHGALCTALLEDASMQKDYRPCVKKLASAPRKRRAALIRCLGPGMETRTQGSVLKTGRIEQASRVVYISHVWTATYLQLREPQSKDGRNRGEVAKRSLRSLQCPALECPRQTPAG
jgi:hypothetical protein